MGVIFALGFFIVVIILLVVFVLSFVAGLITLIIGIIRKKQYKKAGIPKKYPVVLILVGIFLVSVPVIIIGSYFVEDALTVSSWERMEMISQNTIESFEEKDCARLLECFMSEIADSKTLEKEIEQTFSFIDGEIVSYIGPIYGSKDRESDKYSNYEYYDVEIDEIQTDTGKTYEIFIYMCTENSADEDNVGIKYLCITDMDEYTYENDYPKEARIIIGNYE